MADWTPEQAASYKEAFLQFCNAIEIKSKEEEDWVNLGKNLYGGQKIVIDRIFDGLSNSIHDFKVLKSRQLGISTIIRALVLFWAGAHVLTGALVFDTAQHLDEARVEMLDMLERLPDSFRFPRKQRDNRYSLILDNRSRINLLAAGVKETKGSKGLGAGSAISLAHRSELCNYGNTAGLEHFRHSMARRNPNRLFIDESTALGFNQWYEIYQEAKLDHHCMCIFVGWWSHPGQRIERDDPDFERYGVAPLSAWEKDKIQEVFREYGHEITPEQLAWIRRENKPTAQQEGSEDADYTAEPIRLQNQPWTEKDAFQQSGAVFFDDEKLTEQSHKNASRKYKAFSYVPGVEFTDFRVLAARNERNTELKVWEEPLDDATYIVAADVAFGHDENNDRSAIQVLRCFADGVDQVAEYAWPLINTRQFAWVIASLEGWYAGDVNEVYRIIEINGPGEAVFNELRSLKNQIDNRYFGDQLDQMGLRNIQKNVKNYFYMRTDSLNPGRSMMWKTSTQLKVAIFERLRDFTSNGMLHIRSLETLEEMRTITREGDSIHAAGTAKDDRVFSMALGLRQWDEVVRRQMVAKRRTRANDEAKRRMTVFDQVSMYNQTQFEAFLNGRAAQRRALVRGAQRRSWRGG